MEIRLQHLQLGSITADPEGSIWGKDVLFSSGSGYLLRAPSGSGKTTLLSLLCGLRKDYTGTVRFDGDDISYIGRRGWASLRRNKISIIFQELNLFNLLSAEENIRIKQNLSGRLQKDRIREYADRLGMTDHLKKKVQILSVGQKQRIAIIRSLVQPFQFLLMDEPFSHLDPENIRNACSLIRDVCSEQQAGYILTSLHDPYDLNHSVILHL